MFLFLKRVNTILSLSVNQNSSFNSSAVYSDCSPILSQNIVTNFSKYIFSIISERLEIGHLKGIVCEILFGPKEYNEKALLDKLVTKGLGEIHKIAQYSDKAQLGTVSLIKILADISNRMKRITLIAEAARYGMDNVVEKLLESKANPNTGICPPLHRAAMGASQIDQNEVSKYLTTARLLINNGAQINSRDAKGYTALHFSTYSPTFAKVLVNEGGSALNKFSSSGVTSLDWAEYAARYFKSAAAYETYTFLKSKGAERGPYEGSLNEVLYTMIFAIISYITSELTTNEVIPAISSTLSIITTLKIGCKLTGCIASALYYRARTGCDDFE